MWLPPARIAATNVRTLRPGRAPPTRPARRTVWLISRSSPRRNISVAGTISPASATSASSLKVTSMRSTVRDTRLTGSASRVGPTTGFEHRHRPSSGRLFRGYATAPPATSSVDRGLEAERIGPHVGTEQYGICSESPGLTARPPGNPDNGAPRRRTYPRIFFGVRGWPIRRGLRSDGAVYSITTTTSPEPTDWPAVTLTSLTVPDLSAAMLFSIFIASSTHTVWPASTSSPSDTSTFTIVPCIGTVTAPVPAARDDPPADRRGRGGG